MRGRVGNIAGGLLELSRKDEAEDLTVGVPNGGAGVALAGKGRFLFWLCLEAPEE